MNAWAQRWARMAGVTGASLVLLAGLPLQWSVPTTVTRGAVVGFALYVAVRLLAALAGETVLRTAIAERLANASSAEAAEFEEQKSTEEAGADSRAA